MLLVSLSLAIVSSSPTEESRIKGAFFGSLVADALCLGSHYEYVQYQLDTSALLWHRCRDAL